MNPSQRRHLLSHESQQPHAFVQQHAHSSYRQHEEPSPPYSTQSDNYSPRDQFEIPPSKRQKLASPVLSEPGNREVDRRASEMPAEPAFRHDRPGSALGLVGGGTKQSRTAATPNPAAPAKSRRVRTGCLTCRERHLKCDEGTPDCNNCRKSSRECKRGLRLNFIDTQVKNPPMVPPTRDWSVQFHDESRMIASEYRGGLGRYPRSAEDITPPRELEAASLPPSYQKWNYQPQAQPANPASYQDSHPPIRKESDAYLPPMAHTPAPQGLPAPSATPTRGGVPLDQYPIREDAFRRSQGHRLSDFSCLPSPCFPPGSALTPGLVPDGLMTPPTERSGEREYLASEDEIRFMQAYTDSVAIWMDVMDKEKQFSRVLPYLALQSPMLLNALLSCGAKHLSLVEGRGEEKAHYYYDEATKALLKCLQNPDRNTAECATTAVILNVYEIMTEKPSQRMTHIAGARALIRECGWDATSTGVSGACFWVNIGMEVLSCLAFNWQTAWDPDQWGLDLEFTNWTPTPRTGGGSVDGDKDDALKRAEGDEEPWVHRILYILAKVTNFHASIPRFQEASPHDEQARRQSRFNEWKRLKGLCDAWNSKCPRSMQPYGYCPAPSSTSLFPRVWLVKRPSILARLFYHTAMCMLAQINPMEARDSEDNRMSQLLHAHHTCGIIAHTNDPAIASGALRSLAVAGAVLTDRREQMEVLEIMERRSKETGWRLGRVVAELKAKWGWESNSSSAPSRALSSVAGTPSGPALSSFLSPLMRPEEGQSPMNRTATSTPSALKPTVNPLLANADFGKKNHPYQNYYEPPNRTVTAAPSPQAMWTA